MTRFNTDSSVLFSYFSEELRFVVAQCRTGPLSDHTRYSIGDRLDWDEVIRISAEHGVLPLISKQLAKPDGEIRVPEMAATTIRETAQRSAVRNLYLSKRLLEILSVLKQRGIIAVPFKGPALAAGIYGNLGLRHSCDLDLLVRKQDLRIAIDALASTTLQPECQLSPQRFRHMLKCECEFAMSDDVLVELHWNVLPRYYCVPIDIEPFWERLNTRLWGASPIQELAAEDLLICLALHARKHYWARLIWICDIAQLLDRTPALDWQLVIANCQKLRIERILLLTLYLSQQLMGAQIPGQIADRLTRDRSIHQLAIWCTRNLQLGLKSSESGLRNYFASLRTREHWGDRAGQVLRHALTPGLAEWQYSLSYRWMDTPAHVLRMASKATGLRSRYSSTK